MPFCCTVLHNLKQPSWIFLNQSSKYILTCTMKKTMYEQARYTFLFKQLDPPICLATDRYWNKSRQRKQLFWMNLSPQVQRMPNRNRHLLCSYMETHAGWDPGRWIYGRLSPAHLCKSQEIEFLHLLLAEPVAHSSASQESLHLQLLMARCDSSVTPVKTGNSLRTKPCRTKANRDYYQNLQLQTFMSVKWNAAKMGTEQ